MEAALVAGQRGHNVKLYEKTDQLGGGQLRLASSIPGKEDIQRLVKYRENMFKKYDNIEVIFNKEVDKNLIESQNTDAVIIATGGKALVPNISGVENKNVVTAFDVLDKKVDVGNSVIVMGGGLIGAETTCSLGFGDKQFKVVEMLDDVATSLDFMTRFWLLEKLNKQGAEIITKTRVKEITESGVVVENSSGDVQELTADTVVVAVGVESVNDLEDQLHDLDADVYTIGDAKQGRKIINAIADGYHLARKL